jgi:RNA polymerase sigma factor (sigma-70 family)
MEPPAANDPQPGKQSDLHGTTTFHVRRAIDGDQVSLAWLVERLSPALVAQAAWRLGTTLRRYYDPEDLVSDVWLRTLPRLHELPARDGRHTPVLLRFLATTTLNVVNNLAKKHLRRDRADLPVHRPGDDTARDPMAGLPSAVTDAVTAAVRNERHRVFAAALEALDPKDREVIMLRGIEQRTNESAGALLGITPAAVGMRFHRALARLREQLPGSVFDEL